MNKQFKKIFSDFITVCEQEQMLLLTNCQQTCMIYTSSSASRLPASKIVGALNHKL